MTLREWKKVAEKDRNRPGAPTIPDKAMADLLKYEKAQDQKKKALQP